MKKYILLISICLVLFSIVALAADDDPVSYSDEDLVKWNHPVKTVFKSNDVVLMAVDIENKVKFSFSVQFAKALKVENEAYFDKIVQGVAKEVKYNDFKIFDDEKEISIAVTCQKGAITQALYNEIPDYFKKMRALAEKQKQFTDLLLKKIPELGDLAKLVEKNSQGKAKMTIAIGAEPDTTSDDKFEKEYYTVAINQVLGEEEKALDEFIVHKDTSEILWNNGEKYLTLDEWRKLITKEPYWPDLFQQ